jgi:ribosomal protein S18 acetylase RimI-like enzyme
MLAVRAELHGQSVGTALLDQAVLVAKRAGSEIGARFLAADVNPPAQGFYQSYGFVSLGSKNEELQRKRERGMVPMVLDLHPRS